MTSFKKLILLVTLLLVFMGMSLGQTFSNTPNDSIQMTGMMEDLETLSIQQLNTSSKTITLKWLEIKEAVPANWEASVCDNQICNTSLVDSGTMNPVSPGEYGLILLHITPHVNYGTATVRYIVWDIANPGLKDTLTYILYVNATSGILQSKTNNVLNIYPNPVKDNLNIITNLSSVFIFTVTDELGREIVKGMSETNSICVSTENFASGIYNVSIYDRGAMITSRKILIQP